MKLANTKSNGLRVLKISECSRHDLIVLQDCVGDLAPRLYSLASDTEAALFLMIQVNLLGMMEKIAIKAAVVRDTYTFKLIHSEVVAFRLGYERNWIPITLPSRQLFEIIHQATS